MQELLATITSKGQVTIPIAVRQSLALKTGDKVAFMIEDSQVSLRKTGSVVAATEGIFKSRRPAKTAEELREAAEIAIAAEVVERSS